MRRSVAPSQVTSLAKRPRFSTPFLKTNNDSNECNNTTVQKIKESGESAITSFTENKPKETCVRSTQEVLQLIGNLENRTKTEQEIVTSSGQNVTDSSTEDKCEEEKKTIDGIYYSVVWCKLSKKKHKKWEGDAILIVKGRTVTLKDMEGKQIGQGAGYKLKDVENLEIGSTLVVGGKEVEIIDTIKGDDYSSGNCFLPQTQPSLVPVPRKRFNPNPMLIVKGPLFDPARPNALVLTRPDQSHQWQFNAQKLPVVDVVVDPHLTGHLRTHQKEGIVFLYECIMGMKNYQGHGAILADEMGLGKTLQSITLIWTLLKQGPYGGRPILKKTLIVTPSSLVQNWVKEFNKWLGKGKIVLYAVDSHHRVKDFAKQPCCPVMIISYEMLMRSCDAVTEMNFDLMICDEGHRLKNVAVKTTSTIANLPIKRRIILTGTPVQNDLQEFFALVEFCNPGVLGSTSSFRRLYEDPIVASRQPNASLEESTLGEKRAAELTRLTALFTLRRTQQVINKFLPPKVENVVFCRPSALQVSLTKLVLNSSVVRKCLRDPDSVHPFVCIAALKKICNHPGLIYQTARKETFDSSATVTRVLYDEMARSFPQATLADLFNETHSGKMKVIADLLAAARAMDSNRRFVIVSGSTKMLDTLQQLCQKNEYPFLRLDGSTQTIQRQSIVDLFNQTSSYFVFLLSSKAGGVGFNLIGASSIILFDIDWNPAHDLQAMARVWRDGQKRTVHIYRLLTTGTIEEKIFQRQISKQNLSGAVVDHLGSCAQFTKEELKDLFTLHEDTQCLTHDRLECNNCNPDQSIDCQQEIDQRQISPLRPYQLTVAKKSTSKSHNLSMAKLLDWRHLSLPKDKNEVNDQAMEAAADQITYIFRNTCNNNNFQV